MDPEDSYENRTAHQAALVFRDWAIGDVSEANARLRTENQRLTRYRDLMQTVEILNADGETIVVRLDQGEFYSDCWECLISAVAPFPLTSLGYGIDVEVSGVTMCGKADDFRTYFSTGGDYGNDKLYFAIQGDGTVHLQIRINEFVSVQGEVEGLSDRDIEMIKQGQFQSRLGSVFARMQGLGPPVNFDSPDATFALEKITIFGRGGLHKTFNTWYDILHTTVPDTFYFRAPDTIDTAYYTILQNRQSIAAALGGLDHVEANGKLNIENQKLLQARDLYQSVEIRCDAAGNNSIRTSVKQSTLSTVTSTNDPFNPFARRALFTWWTVRLPGMKKHMPEKDLLHLKILLSGIPVAPEDEMREGEADTDIVFTTHEVPYSPNVKLSGWFASYRNQVSHKTLDFRYIAFKRSAVEHLLNEETEVLESTHATFQ